MINKSYKKILGIIAVTSFIFVVSFGAINMVPSHHHEPGCPFMIGEQAVCAMDLFDHIRAWQSTFMAYLPSVLLLIALAYVCSAFWKITDPPNRLLSYLYRPRRCQADRNILYQELFSQGILNPKAP